MLDKVVSCENCNKIYIKTRSDLCNECEQIVEDKFHLVRTFINERHNYSASMQEVVSGTNVEESLISGWIKEGRLRIVHMTNLHYSCESCGSLTNSGRICRSCSSTYSELLKDYSSTRSSGQTYRVV